MTVCLVLVASVGCSEPAPRPDVILIVVDTLRADRTSPYGYARDTTPRLTALAGESLRFLNAFSTAPWTTPAVAAILTGRHPRELGIRNVPVPIPPSVPTIASILRQHGYATGAVVSHLFVGRKYGFAHHFDRFDETQAGGPMKISSPGVTDRAIEMLDDLEPPLFLMAHYFDPHFDYLNHAEFEFGHGDDRRAQMTIIELRKAAKSGELTRADLEAIRDRYDSEIAFTDAHLGRLFDALRERGRFDDALVVFVGDHGEAFMDRPDRWIGHTLTVFQELIHVPLIIKLPRASRVGSEASYVSTVDLLPTIFDVLDIDVGTTPDALERSLLRHSPDRTVYAETARGASLEAVAQKGWKLIRDTRSGEARLFDLRADLGERFDRAADVREMLERLETLRVSWSRGLTERRSVEPALNPEERERLRALGYTE